MIDNPEIVKHYKSAVELEAKGKLKSAIEELERAVKLNPTDGNVYNRLGDLYIKVLRKPEAIEMFKKGIEAFREDTYFRNSLALCKKVLKYDPSNTDIYPVMGKLLVALDAKSDALPYLFEYIERQKEKKDAKEVIETLDYIRELGVSDKQLIERMMEIYKSVGRTDRAKLLAEAQPGVESVKGAKLVFDRTISVLLVEDDEDDYIITRDMINEISEIRFKLEWARTYSAGLELICSPEYDVCLLDYHLGQHTGLDLLRAAIEKGCTIPVILLTGQGGREVDLEAMYAGAADYLIKGRTDAKLLERSIRYAIERNLYLKALQESQDKLRTQLIRALALMDALNENQEKLNDLAIRDSLTGLFNRRHFMEIMATAITAAKNEGNPLGLCIATIDRFKEINDLYGYQVGDEVLLAFVQIIKKNLSPENTVGRYGGDEFCILFPSTTVDKVVATAVGIRDQLAQMNFKAESGETFKVQGTFGIAELSGSMNLRELFQLADLALCEAKAAGRNRIVVKKSTDK